MSKKLKFDNPADMFISSAEETTTKVETKKPTEGIIKEVDAKVEQSSIKKPRKSAQPIKKDLSNDYTCYKLSEVASISRLSARTIQTYVKEGVLPAKMVGNKWLVSKEDLERLLSGELKRNSCK